MRNNKRILATMMLGLSVIALMAIITACGAPPTPAPVVQTVVVRETAAPVVQTVVVKETVVAPTSAPVVQTVVVKETVVAPTSPPPAASCPTAKDKYKIGFANLTEDIVFTKLVREGIEANAKKAGNIELVLADNKLDGATALANADSFITQGVDGVIEFQTDEKFGNVIMDKFRAKGIPVIAIDIPMPGATFFGADNYRAGRRSAAVGSHSRRAHARHVGRLAGQSQEQGTQ